MCTKVFLREVGPYKRLYRCQDHGIAWIEDGSAGIGISAHPNIDSSASAPGMVRLGYWGKDDVIVQCHGWKYNVSHSVGSEELDEIARSECQCGGNHA